MFLFTQKKPNPPTPGIQLTENPINDKPNYNAAKQKIIDARKKIQHPFQGSVIQKSKGAAIKQLTHGIIQQIISTGKAHGHHQQQKLYGNIVQIPSTAGVTWFLR